MSLRDDARIIINIPRPDGGTDQITLPPELELDVLAFAEASGMTVQQVLDRAISEQGPKLMAEMMAQLRRDGPVERASNPPEEITFHAHAGACRYCKGPVKMMRDPNTFALVPDNCWCLGCGQPYYVVTDDIVKWEQDQWRQKARIEES